MRAAVIMCSFVLCATLSLHYVMKARAETESSNRSDPLVLSSVAYPCDDEDAVVAPRKDVTRTVAAGAVFLGE